MWALKLLLIPVIAYLATLALIYFAQTSLLFPARMVQGTGQLPPGATGLTLATPDGEQLHGLHLSPIRSSTGERLVILGFGGNAWNAAAAAEYLQGLYPEADVVAFHYRGYAPSSGRPSAEALLSDAPLVYDLVRARLGSGRIVAVGFSIGSGVAAYLSSKRNLAGLILVTPFDSLIEVARAQYPWLPVRLLFRHPMTAADDLRRSDVPTAIVAAGRDTLIPAERTDALRAAAPNLVFDRNVKGAGHNDLYDRPEFRTAMDEALRSVLGPEAGRGS
jgi:pimeloyl-ACP methyl ester carboxylesterase